MVESRGKQFEERYQAKLEVRLGFGVDGTVMSTDRQTAVKLFDRREPYARERNVYLLFQALAIDEIRGHHVPQFVRYDDELLAIEMTIVRPPYLLDFASAYPEGEEPDFPPEVWDDWRAEKAEAFGSRWPDVERLLEEVREQFGIILLDPNPGNITFG